MPIKSIEARSAEAAALEDDADSLIDTTAVRTLLDAYAAVMPAPTMEQLESLASSIGMSVSDLDVITKVEDEDTDD